MSRERRAEQPAERSAGVLRNPIRALLGQGAWYAASNALLKVAGLLLLPVYTNAAYLLPGEYGLWGVFLVTQQIAVGVLGLQLSMGLVRFYAEAERPADVAATAWWLTVALAAAGAIAGGLAARILAGSQQLLYGVLIGWVTLELLMTIPLAVLRAQERAGTYALVSALKLSLFIVLTFYLVVGRGWGLTGLVGANAMAAGAGLVVGLVAVASSGLVRLRVPRPVRQRLLRFSVPFVAAGLGSLALNAADRYVLVAFRDEAEVALYQLAAQFGGVVNMLVVQPLVLAFLPLLFRLAPAQRPEVLRLLLKYGSAAVGLLTLGLTLFTPYVLLLMRSDAFYLDSVPLIPYVALGFGIFGLSILFDGVLLVHERSGTTSAQLTGAAVANVALNLALVPFLGALGAALTTLLSYLGLFVARVHVAQRLEPVEHAWPSVVAAALVTAAIALGAGHASLPADGFGFLVRLGLFLLWAGVLLLGRWFTVAEAREAVHRLMPGSGASGPKHP